MKNSYKLVVIALLVCFSTSLKAQTAGTMSFTFTTPKHTTGNYETNGRYVLAVWIESCGTTASCGAGTTVGTSTFVKTNYRYWSGSTNDHLPTWNSKSAGSIVGAVAAGTGATQTLFTARTFTWDGKNAAATALLADGYYRVCIQETWGHGTATATRYFPFTKGTATYTNTADVAADTNFTGISLTWTPQVAANSDFNKGPEVVVYPNPSKGIFNLDLKSQINNITVVNTLGAIIYEENIDKSSTETTKSIDLSNYTNGVYFINVSDDNGSSNYKVILDK
jgi:Secretion system C-terminal sorting domain